MTISFAFTVLPITLLVTPITILYEFTIFTNPLHVYELYL